ncbi:MAG: hypothetical protein ABL957_06560 [Parvularculaceae bacterium]
MRRAHRRTHVIFWSIILPATLWALALALGARPIDPRSELPAAIAGEAP